MRFLFIFLGTAGDSLAAWHHNMSFSTKDQTMTKILAVAVPFRLREPGGTINVMPPT